MEEEGGEMILKRRYTKKEEESVRSLLGYNRYRFHSFTNEDNK